MPDQTTAIVFRPPTLADLDAVVALIVACSQAIRGTADAANERRVLRGDWEREDIDLATDAWLATLPGGEIVGYALVFDLRMAEAATCDSYVHPAHRDRGIGTPLIRLATERLMREATSLPSQQTVIYGSTSTATTTLPAGCSKRRSSQP